MTLALATRGYLCPVGTILVLQGPGPVIARSTVVEPEIVGAAHFQEAAPTLSGSVQPGPSITGSGGQKPSVPAPPSITGGIKPKIG